ncbi:hypothetical protein F4782DRAFT_529916 [Xylaria castorea]|nr:hypothetical protein F4782DRAFT_529916 [Xylaria castorea]
MCTCNAFTYRSCRYGHAKFEPVAVCLAARLGLRAKCQERIVNGNPDIVRAWPVIDGICDVCCPNEAKAEEEEKRTAEKTKKDEEERDKKEQKERERKVDKSSFPTFTQPPLEIFPSASDFEVPEESTGYSS